MIAKVNKIGIEVIQIYASNPKSTYASVKYSTRAEHQKIVNTKI